MGSRAWNATTFVSSARIISLPPAPPAPIAHPLQLCSFVVGSAFVGTSSSVEARQWLLCLGPSSKVFFERVFRTPGLSWIPSGLSFKIISPRAGLKHRLVPLGWGEPQLRAVADSEEKKRRHCRITSFRKSSARAGTVRAMVGGSLCGEQSVMQPYRVCTSTIAEGDTA